MTAISAATTVAALLSTMSIPVDAPGGTASKVPVNVFSEFVDGGKINALMYGVNPDGRILTDVSMTNGGSTVTSTSYPFTSADVGKLIAVKLAGPSDSAAVGGFQSLCAYIGSVSGGVASLVTTSGGSTPATSSRAVSNAVATFGTDNTTAHNAAMVAANARYIATGSPQVISYPVGIMVQSDTITQLSGVKLAGQGKAATMFKYIRSGVMGSAMLTGLDKSKTDPYMDIGTVDLGMDLLDAYASYAVSKKHLYFQFIVGGEFSRCLYLGSIATSVGIDFLAQSQINDNVFMWSARGNIGGAGGAAIGIGTIANDVITARGVTQVEGVVVRGNYIYAPTKWGIFFESQSSAARSNGIFIVEGNIVDMTSVSVGRGISDSGNINMQILNNTVRGVGQGTGIAVREGLNSTALPGYQGRISGNIVVGTNIGFEVDYTNATAAISAGQSVTNNKAISCTIGYSVKTPSNVAYVLSNLDFAGSEAFNCTKQGWDFTGTAPLKRLGMKNVKSYNNGTSGTGTRSGVYFAVNADIVDFEGSDLFDDKGTPTQTYGIETASGVAVTNVRLPSYAFAGNVTAPIGGAGTVTGTKQTSAAYP